MPLRARAIRGGGLGRCSGRGPDLGRSADGHARVRCGRLVLRAPGPPESASASLRHLAHDDASTRRSLTSSKPRPQRWRRSPRPLRLTPAPTTTRAWPMPTASSAWAATKSSSTAGTRSADFGAEFTVPEDLARPVLRRLFPWAPTDLSPWPALLWANGRIDLPRQSWRPGPDWIWQCAPSDEWDDDAGRWRPHWSPGPPATAVRELSPQQSTR